MKNSGQIKNKLKQWSVLAALGITAAVLLAVFFVLSLWIIAGAAVLFLTGLLFAILSGRTRIR